MEDLTRGTVASTRVRLARNLEGYPFPSRLKDEKQAKEIIRRVSSGFDWRDEFNLYYMNAIPDEQAISFIEKHLISPNLLKSRNRSAALINAEESVSIMINEEDHLREQCILKGLDLRLAYDTISEIDAKLGKAMRFAYDEQFGYLTACPTNLGTGQRASVMMFLPALTLNGLIPKVIRSVSRLGLTVRGIYGEGSEAEGFMYQISNEVTLGVTEEEILCEVENVVGKICELENVERNNLKFGENSLSLKDECLRSYGILTNCAKLTSKELERLAAKVKIGATLGYINIPDVSLIDDIVVKLQPSSITTAAQKVLTPEERDTYRAQYCVKNFKNITND